MPWTQKKIKSRNKIIEFENITKFFFCFQLYLKILTMDVRNF